MVICFSLLFAIVFKNEKTTTITIAIFTRAITIFGAIEKRSHEPLYKFDTNNKSDRLGATSYSFAFVLSWKSDNFMESNWDKSNIYIFKVNQKSFHILGAPIIFSSTVLIIEPLNIIQNKIAEIAKKYILYRQKMLRILEPSSLCWLLSLKVIKLLFFSFKILCGFCRFFLCGMGSFFIYNVRFYTQ